MYQKSKLHQDIRDAVLVCMETTDIKDIRVQTLLRMTGISKATFYRNYRSVESIVKEMEAEFVSGLRDINSKFIGSRLQIPFCFSKTARPSPAIWISTADFCRSSTALMAIHSLIISTPAF